MKRPITNLVIGLMAFFATHLAAQPTFTLSPTAITANVGDVITVNVVVNNFTALQSFQYSTNWNAAALQLQVPIGGLNLAGLSQGSFGTNQIANGILTTSWSDPAGGSVTVPNGTVIYSMSFMVLSTTGATISFASTPTPFEVINANGQDVGGTTTFTPTQVNGGGGTGGGGGGTGGGGGGTGGGGGGTNPGGITLTASDNTAATGSQTCVSVTVNDFDNIVSMQYTMEFDETKWQFANVPTASYGLPGLSAGNFGLTLTNQGYINFTWDAPGGTAINIADNTVIYQVCLNATGVNNCNATTPFEFNGEKTIIEVRDGAGALVTLNSVAGDLTICNNNTGGGGGGNANDLTIIAADVESPNGSQVCVPIRANNFDCVVSAQFMLFFNPSISQFVSVQSFGLPGMDASSFGTTETAAGKLKFSWASQDPVNGNTVADGATLFQVCFNVVGTNGQVGNITFGQDLTGNIPFQIEVTSCSSSNVTTVFDPGTVTVGITCSGPVTIPSNVVTNVACPGTNTGAINITVAGGSATKTYLWSNGATTEDISNLAAGTYTVTVTSCGGAQTTTQPFTVTSTNTAINIDFQKTNIVCFGETNGAVDITVTGGATSGTGCTGYAYLWSNGATTADVTGLPAGNYTVTVTDCNGCQRVSSTFNIATSTSLLAISETHTDVSCNGNANGSITVTGTGGGNTKEYRLNSGNWGSNNVFTGLTAGNYNVHVRDEFGCTKTTPVTITQPNVISTSSTFTAPTVGMNNGSIDLTVTGGVPPYTYSWSGPNGPISGNPEDPTNLAAGTYCVTVTDANACTRSHCRQVVAPLTDNPQNPSGVVKNTCFGSCTGEIEVNPIGGITPYTYAWSGPGNPTGANPTGLCAGNYTVTVTSSTGTPSTTMSFTVVGATSLPSVATSQLEPPTSSAACNGSILLSTIGGAGSGYSYQWSSNANGQVGNPAIALCEGTYFVTITDGNGCTGTGGPFVLEYTPIVLGNPQVNATNSCAAPQQNGEIEISIFGGTLPYVFQITSGAYSESLTSNSNSITFDNLPAGTYTYTITDSGNGVDQQSKTGTIIVGQTVLNLTNDVTHTTNSQGGGSVDVTPSGGQLPYTYSWNNGAGSQDLFNVAPGCYELTLVDANGCVRVFGNIGVGLLAVELDGQEPPCAQDLGSITATPVLSGSSCASANAPYTYVWRNAQGDNIGTQATLNNAVAGNYSVSITDANGTSIVQTYQLNAISNLSVTAAATTDYNGFEIRCFGNSDGKASAFPANGAGGTYTYLWSNGATTQSLINLTAGTYTVTVEDGEECEMTATITLEEPQPLSSTANATNSGCTEGDNGQATAIVSGGVSPYSYLWSNGVTGPTSNNLPDGNVSVTVTDFNGCTMVENVPVPEGTELDVVEFSVPDSGGPNGQAGVTVSGGTWPYEYTWKDYPTATDSVLTELFPGEYLVLVTDANDCQVAKTIKVRDETLCGEVRTVITPEGDGKNEEFLIECLNRFSDNTLEIFNRWGQLVYRTEDYNDSDLWRGTTISGSDVPDGVYFYVFNYFDPGINAFVTKKGSVTVLRK